MKLIFKYKRRKNGEASFRQTCFFKDCQKLQRSKWRKIGLGLMYDKFCNFHHRNRYNLEAIRLKADYWNIDNSTCSSCGWNKASCDRHRIVRELGYKKGNMVILCPNCHRLAHLEKIA